MSHLNYGECLLQCIMAISKEVSLNRGVVFGISKNLFRGDYLVNQGLLKKLESPGLMFGCFITSN